MVEHPGFSLAVDWMPTSGSTGHLQLDIFNMAAHFIKLARRVSPVHASKMKSNLCVYYLFLSLSLSSPSIYLNVYMFICTHRYMHTHAYTHTHRSNNPALSQCSIG